MWRARRKGAPESSMTLWEPPKSGRTVQLLATNLRTSDKIFVSGHLLVGPQPHIVQLLSGLSLRAAFSA
jgi:hypothetical protein